MLARSAFEHSANYDAVVLLGSFQKLDNEQKLQALHAFMERQLPGRWSEVRAPNRKELKATVILALPIREASVKTRTGPPDDDKSPDAELGVWAGVIPLQTTHGGPNPRPVCARKSTPRRVSTSSLPSRALDQPPPPSDL